jgi:hypothetical protein
MKIVLLATTDHLMEWIVAMMIGPCTTADMIVDLVMMRDMIGTRLDYG